jgi:3-oxoacyl-[acyl-carrier-protein] synthase I
MTAPVPPAVVTALGVATPLGLSAAASEAAFRAGMMAVTETAVLGHGGEPLRASWLETLPPELSRPERMRALADLALEDLLDAGPREWTAKLGLFLGLPGVPDDDAGGTGALGAAVAAALEEWLSPPQRWFLSFHHGRSAAFYALEAAMTALASERCDVALVGGVDSLCAPATLESLDAEHRLLGASPLGGVIPGEAAAFVRLERGDSAEAAGRAKAVLLTAATAHDPCHFYRDEPTRGDGLAAVFRSLRESSWTRGRRAHRLYTGETGEAFWAEELSLAALRNAPIVPEPFVRTMAAESFGDLGAASGAVLLALAIQGFAKHGGHADPLTVLICSSSDDGHVGGCLVASLPRGGDERP